MLILDVNVLVYAYLEESPHHTFARGWLDDLINQADAFGLSELACSGFLRVVTRTAAVMPASPPGEAIDFIEALRRPASMP